MLSSSSGVDFDTTFKLLIPERAPLVADNTKTFGKTKLLYSYIPTDFHAQKIDLHQKWPCAIIQHPKKIHKIGRKKSTNSNILGYNQMR